MSLLEWVTLISGIIAILVVVVPLTVKIIRYLIERGHKKRPTKPTKWLRHKAPQIIQYLHKEIEELSRSIAPGSSRLRVKDLVSGDEVFIPPDWSFYIRANPATPASLESQELEAYLLERITAGERVLLLGDTGQGKSTLLKRIFYRLSQAFGGNPTTPIPLYIPCRDLDLDRAEERNLEGLYQYLHSGINPLPLTPDEFRQAVENKFFIFLFDGFDEIRGSINQEVINQRVDSEIFLNPGLLSCRLHFYEIHLSLSEVDYRFPTKVLLQPLDNPSVAQYVQNVCAKLDLASSDQIITTIQQDPKLEDLSKRLLLLVMITDILSRRSTAKNYDWSSVKLYAEYTQNWLKNEARKSVLAWDDKSRLLEQIAWELFTAKLPSTLAYGDTQKITISRDELRILLAALDMEKQLQLSLNDILDDVCAHTLLAHSAENYHFVHRSFQEYYVAKYVFGNVKAGSESAQRVLCQPLPVEIATFLKEMLDPGFLQPTDIEIITNNLVTAYRASEHDDSEARITLREQAGYYLSRMQTERAAAILEQIATTETNKFVQRGIIVGLIYTFKRENIVDEYLERLHTDAEADAINIGYHLEYYGDQAPQGDHRDKQGPRCERTVAAILRHLKNPDEHRIGWALDLLTLRRLLETRGQGLSTCLAADLAYLQQFLDVRSEDRAALKKEKSLLKARLEELELI